MQCDAVRCSASEASPVRDPDPRFRVSVFSRGAAVGAPHRAGNGEIPGAFPARVQPRRGCIDSPAHRAGNRSAHPVQNMNPNGVPEPFQGSRAVAGMGSSGMRMPRFLGRCPGYRPSPIGAQTVPFLHSLRVLHAVASSLSCALLLLPSPAAVASSQSRSPRQGASVRTTTSCGLKRTISVINLTTIPSYTFFSWAIFGDCSAGGPLFCEMLKGYG